MKQQQQKVDASVISQDDGKQIAYHFWIAELIGILLDNQNARSKSTTYVVKRNEERSF